METEVLDHLIATAKDNGALGELNRLLEFISVGSEHIPKASLVEWISKEAKRLS